MSGVDDARYTRIMHSRLCCNLYVVVQRLNSFTFDQTLCHVKSRFASRTGPTETRHLHVGQVFIQNYSLTQYYCFRLQIKRQRDAPFLAFDVGYLNYFGSPPQVAFLD